MRIRPQTAPLSTYTPTLSLAIQRRITGQGRQHHPWKAEGERGSKSSGPGRWGCSFEGVPLPFSPPHHFPVMAQSEATSHRNSHRQGEKWMCASALNGDANLARGPPLGRERRGSATGSFSLAWFSPKSSFSAEITSLFSLRCVCPWEALSCSALKAKRKETSITDAQFIQRDSL